MSKALEMTEDKEVEVNTALAITHRVLSCSFLAVAERHDLSTADLNAALRDGLQTVLDADAGEPQAVERNNVAVGAVNELLELIGRILRARAERLQ